MTDSDQIWVTVVNRNEPWTLHRTEKDADRYARLFAHLDLEVGYMVWGETTISFEAKSGHDCRVERCWRLGMLGDDRCIRCGAHEAALAYFVDEVCQSCDLEMAEQVPDYD